ncbi:MAG TPA: glycosyl transferase [Methylophilaceae bacterium]|nr:glycosyl transferase [Methylophilaceae bacterium]HAJ72420.1 glycosyl transferase [Methylophilaceae bacterium]
MVSKSLTVLQVLPALESGGVERGTLEVGKYLVDKGHRSIVMSAGGRMVEQLTQEGSEHYAWPIGKKSLWTLMLINRLRDFLVEHQVDILHVRSRMPAWICYLAWKGMPEKSRPRLVTTVHGPYSESPYSAVMTRGERVIAISEMIRTYILTHYPQVPEQHIRLIYRGVDAAVFTYGFKPDALWMKAWQAQYPHLTGKRLLTIPARLTRWKGQEDFITMMAKLVESGLDVHGLIVGEAQASKQDFLSDLQSQVQSLGLENHITFIGHRSDVREVMAISHIVYSLAKEPEAFGRTTLEALSMGVPVIGYDHGGVSEQLNKLLPEGAITVGHQAQLLEVTKRWLTHAPKVNANELFTLQSMLDKTFDVYCELAQATNLDR